MTLTIYHSQPGNYIVCPSRHVRLLLPGMQVGMSCSQASEIKLKHIYMQAEDARLLGEFGVMRKMYTQLQHLNRWGIAA